jgi:hypothetical protein
MVFLFFLNQYQGLLKDKLLFPIVIASQIESMERHSKEEGF